MTDRPNIDADPSARFSSTYPRTDEDRRNFIRRMELARPTHPEILAQAVWDKAMNLGSGGPLASVRRAADIVDMIVDSTADVGPDGTAKEITTPMGVVLNASQLEDISQRLNEIYQLLSAKSSSSSATQSDN